MPATAHTPSIEANGRTYRWPVRPTAVICFDGCDPAYIAASGSAGHIPTISRFLKEGFYTVADAAMPTFTNPNNISIVCGAPPAVHGVAGNYYLDRETTPLKQDGRDITDILSKYVLPLSWEHINLTGINNCDAKLQMPNGSRSLRLPAGLRRVA